MLTLAGAYAGRASRTCPRKRGHGTQRDPDRYDGFLGGRVVMVATLLRSRRRKGASKAERAQAEAEKDEDEELRYKPIEWPLVWRLVTWLKPYRKMYSLGLVLGLVHVLLEMLGP